MEFLEEMMIKSRRLNKDITEGPAFVHSQAERKLIDAFLSHHEKQGEEDFYLVVALEWVKEKEKKSIHSSIFWAFLLFVLLIITLGLTIANGFMEGVVAILLLALGPLCAVFGLFNAFRGKGCMKVVMVGIHLFLLFLYTLLLI
ncbi:hypothetical protein [Sinobaca sp. H24]|uniref:hypothetical protein n=1 Tax=Sinobaca sp. H24 TaxID=2923376 RepID=UPI00207A70E5|nr:hypothetical protein [Sinobaca sp. H24]